MLGTFVEIKLETVLSQQQAHQAIDDAFSCIEQVQQLMSFHDANSELSLLNREAYQRPIQVHPYTYAVLKRAQRIFQISQGLFDCSIANTLMTWSLLPQHYSILPNTSSQADLQLLNHHQVRFKAPICLDLGGIAKGFAVDLAIHCLAQQGIKTAVVNAGGDLRVLGTTAEPIVIRDPHHPSQLHPLGELSNGAIATSASYYSKQHYQSEWVNALVVPQTRQAIPHSHSFSVIAPQAWLADALTKVVAVSANPNHACLKQFAATAVIFP